ncbi:response regulator [Pedobacter sp. MC2016-05]|uniref:response regulator n=1 Tax=Pedobacter sp. MC2016-05 TaxID=2994474 RepID=UPI0022453F79|nr:response regulator [Pedobacter sp. MC2016-05]MCX2473196.1 response regulator [Pedobacter sp. MC2016-05]
MRVKEILVIDGEIHMLNLLQILLKDKYQIHLKSGALEALQWLQQGNLPDLIITEYEMPHMNGLELINNLHISGLYSNVPVIILSAMQDVDLHLKMSARSVAACVSKPFNPEVLDMAITGVFSKYEFN